MGGIVDATLMVQREVADRMAASPGNGEYGVLSIFMQLHAEVRRILTLPAGAFRPVPKVRSAVINLRFRPPAVVLADELAFEAMVRTMFMQRRKTLFERAGTIRGVEAPRSGAALDASGIDRRRRPETLQLTELARLADYFASA